MSDMRSILNSILEATDEWGCKDCRVEELGPMVVARIWETIRDTDEDVLCLQCMERRLGRPLVAAEVCLTPLSEMALFEYAIGCEWAPGTETGLGDDTVMTELHRPYPGVATREKALAALKEMFADEVMLNPSDRSYNFRRIVNRLKELGEEIDVEGMPYHEERMHVFQKMKVR